MEVIQCSLGQSEQGRAHFLERNEPESMLMSVGECVQSSISPDSRCEKLSLCNRQASHPVTSKTSTN